MKFDRSRFIARFVGESREHVEYLSKAILDLEAQPEALGALPEIKRAAHTLKGSARMLKFLEISKVAHGAEDLFVALMEGKISCTPPLTDLLLTLVDYMKSSLDAVSEGGEEPPLPDTLLENCEKALRGEVLPQSSSPSAPEASPSPGPEALSTSETLDGGEGQAGLTVEETLRISVTELDHLVDSVGEASVDQQVQYGHLLALLRHGKTLLDEERGERGKIHDRDRVHGVLEAVMSQLTRLEERSYQLNSDLQVLFDETQRLRMIPLSVLFDQFLRPIRDLARTEGKNLRLEISGGDMRLDKQIVDRLHAPLLHILNNAVAHAVEAPEERRAAGKAELSILRVEALSQAGTIEIIVTDDGRGMDTDRLVEKAIERGFLSEKEAASLSRQECLHLAFRPGISSAPIITELSGRGVGMDVVKKTVEELKGSIQLATERGKGTTITLRLPLSLSSRSVFLVDVGQERCAIPLSAVFSTVLCSDEDFIDVAGRRALRVENLFVPVAEARELLGIRSASKRPGDRRVVLILSSGSERLALIVDELVDEREILIKPLHPLLDGLRFVGGITFGDQGEPLPVLYVPDLIASARSGAKGASPARLEEEASEEAVAPLRILVVEDSFNTREVQRHILESAGYEVGMAGDGIEALERLETEHYDAVVSDVDMPRMDGFELVERLRGDERWAGLPVIIVTSRESDGDRARGIEVGANAYIVKRAFDQERLTSTLHALMS